MPLRIRQHVNPLARKFQQPLSVPDWTQIFDQVYQPWHLDIGCARGKFLLEMAQLQPQVNFLGVEIRRPLVELANQERDELKLGNLHYLFGNINSSAPHLLASIPDSCLQMISIQFPDPWFKKRHNKRRVVQPALAAALVSYLATGGAIFLQSDIEEVAIEMRDRFAIHSELTPNPTVDWLATNPLPVATERELYVQEQDLPVYRVEFTKQTASLEID